MSRKHAGSMPHSFPDHLFSFHHSSFWQTGILEALGRAWHSSCTPLVLWLSCSGWLLWFLPVGLWLLTWRGRVRVLGHAGTGYWARPPFKLSLSLGFPNWLYLQTQACI